MRVKIKELKVIMLRSPDELTAASGTTRHYSARSFGLQSLDKLYSIIRYSGTLEYNTRAFPDHEHSCSSPSQGYCNSAIDPDGFLAGLSPARFFNGQLNVPLLMIPCARHSAKSQGWIRSRRSLNRSSLLNGHCVRLTDQHEYPTCRTVCTPYCRLQKLQTIPHFCD